MSQIKTFNDILNSEPKLKLGELIQLFLLGYDDKIYLNIYQYKNKEYEEVLHDVRIISPDMQPHIDCYIEYITDSPDNGVLLDVCIKEAADER